MNLYSCLLCGVGGQGTVLASRIIAAAAMNRGYFARTAETIGMAQRGGCVTSHVRIGERVPCPLIPEGGADVMLAFEPGEAVRNLPFLKEGGELIVCDRAVQPVTAALAGTDYRAEDMLAYLTSHSEHCRVLHVEDVVRITGSVKAVNVALVGALAQSGAMGLSPADVERAVREKVRPQFLEMNLRALEYGAECVK